MLTPKQRFFVVEYQKDFNATQAAIRAGYSKRTADRIGPELLGKTCIAEAIKEATEKRLKKIEISAERVLQEIARCSLFDVRKLFNEDGSLKPPHEWDDDTAAAVAGLDVQEITVGEKVGTVKKVKTVDKRGSLELLAKHFKLLTEKIEHSGPGGGPIEMSDTELSNRLLTLIDTLEKRSRHGAGGS